MRRRIMQSTDFEMAPVLYQYTGNYQTFTAPGTGWYKIECWGAQGCYAGCYGGYTSGVVRLAKGDNIYVYCGFGGTNDHVNAFNGGGSGGVVQYDGNKLGAGGSATDIRLISGLWSEASSLRSRIMVAAAGAGGASWTSVSKLIGAAGGLWGYHEGNIYGGAYNKSGVGTQANGGLGMAAASPGGNGSFGRGGYGGLENTGGGSGGGAGYYGGGGGGSQNNLIGSGAGGSSFISGHVGCDAINSSGTHTGQPNHYSGKVFKDTLMIDGAGYRWTNAKDYLLLMPKPTGGTYASGAGHTGFGYCKISKSA